MDKELYLLEMEKLIITAIYKVKEQVDFQIYTAGIWTDPDAAASAISFDSKENSIKRVEKSNEWFKKHYDRLIAKGEFEQAKLYLPDTGRNTNPADFELRDLVEVNHLSIPLNWVEETDGECWNELEPLLLEIGDKAFKVLQDLNLHPEFELAVNGPEDWYEHTWK